MKIPEEKIRYPAGPFQRPATPLTVETAAPFINEIELLPGKLIACTERFQKENFQTRTLPGNWTVAQVIHHLADSHMNSQVRIKKALTEDTPPISAYDETAWAQLSDSSEADAQLSINLLKALHARWVILLRSLNDKQMLREFYHPEMKKNISISTNIALYAWHGNHHLGHIELLKEKMGWM